MVLPAQTDPERPLRQKHEAQAPVQTPTPTQAYPGAGAGAGAHALSAAFLDKDLTRRYIRQYTTPAGLAWLTAVMNRGGPYLAFIREEIKKRDLPPELLYLPVIESAYLPTAASSSGATGLWQFMKNSIGPFDMKVSDWTDERMDFWKATQGALRKLEDNYKQLGDWPLALAAYNAGLGAVGRVVKNSGLNDYWLLSEKRLLKNETIQYVPKLLAVSHILSNPRRYGLDMVWQEDPRWVRIPVGRMADLELLSAAAGVDGDLLKKANAELRFAVTPPETNYLLKVRSADAAALLATLAEPGIPLIKYYFHTIRSGDTLLALALRYGVSTAQILGENPGTEERRLQIGAKLRIPALKELTPAIVPAVQEQKAGGNQPFEGLYQVKPGDTLWSIALAHNVSPEILADANGMGLNDILHEGRTLKTPIIKMEIE
ncbi:lytic transglycosylase [Spirochaetia bacterium]|nr:lytic transglycosylase [Spirochaetia bacterium]